MDVRLDNLSADALMMGAGCKETCEANIALSDYADATADWQTVTIPASCLKEAGAAFNDVFTPLVFEANESGSFTLSNVRFTQQAENLAPCPE